MLVKAPPRRKIKYPTGLLGDIESHLPRNHQYKDNDKITWAHEGTHGINSIIRNTYDGNYNASYILNNQAYVSEEPKITLSQIAQAIPGKIRGNVYDLYLIEQQKYWNNQPLYIYDEMSAYMNGTKIGIELNQDYSRIEYSFSCTIELFGYSLILLELIKHTIELQHFPEYVNKFIIEKLKDFPGVYKQYSNLESYLPIWY